MNVISAVPSGTEHAVVREEAALLARARAALGEAKERAARASSAGGLRSVDELRELREQAKETSEDDLPALMLEMSVRRQLLERPVEVALPDPLAPYFAHLAIRDERGRKDYLLGHATFLDPGRGVRIVDWRVAPVAKIFYRHREGDDFDEALPGREIEGTVLARRVLVIEGGEIARILGDHESFERLPDGRWAHVARGGFASGGAGTAARAGAIGAKADVTALLDAQQFAAIAAPPEQPLVVLGSAGSGKTTVALHRLARIGSADPTRFPYTRATVVVPEEGLARLSARLLAPLASDAVRVRTLDAWAREIAVHELGAAMPARIVEAPALVAALKRSPALYDALHARFAGRTKKKSELKAMRRKLAELFTDRPFLEGVVAASGGTLSRAAVEATVDHTMLQLAEPIETMLASIVVPEMKQAVDGRPIDEGTPDELAGSIDVEDLPIMLAIRAWRGELAAPRAAHAVLDEAEDFSLFELFVMGKLLGDPASITLAGDEAQQTSPSFAGWDRAVSTLGVRDAVTCRLAVSYRCPRPIVELARRVLGPLAPSEPAEAARDGAPIGFFAFPDRGAADLFLAGALRDLAEEEPRASIAVIANDVEAARRFHAIVAEATSARLVLEGDFTFEPGIDVTDVESCKGLEFDYVVVPDATAAAYPATDVARRRLHVAVTRASHQLWVVSSGRASPLVEGA